MYIYAQLNEDGICIGISQLSGIVEAEDMIPLTEEQLGEARIGRRYDNGVWTDPETFEIPG